MDLNSDRMDSFELNGSSDRRGTSEDNIGFDMNQRRVSSIPYFFEGKFAFRYTPENIKKSLSNKKKKNEEKVEEEDEEEVRVPVNNRSQASNETSREESLSSDCKKNIKLALQNLFDSEDSIKFVSYGVVAIFGLVIFFAFISIKRNSDIPVEEDFCINFNMTDKDAREISSLALFSTGILDEKQLVLLVDAPDVQCLPKNSFLELNNRIEANLLEDGFDLENEISRCHIELLSLEKIEEGAFDTLFILSNCREITININSLFEFPLDLTHYNASFSVFQNYSSYYF